MNTYKHYLQRWSERFGEEKAGMFPLFRQGQPAPTPVLLLSQQEHDQRWAELMALWQEFKKDGPPEQCQFFSAQMRPIEVELLVWGRWFGPDTPPQAPPGQVWPSKSKKGKR